MLVGATVAWKSHVCPLQHIGIRLHPFKEFVSPLVSLTVFYVLEATRKLQCIYVVKPCVLYVVSKQGYLDHSVTMLVLPITFIV